MENHIAVNSVISKTDRVSDEFLAINTCGCHPAGGREYTTLREQGRRDYHIICVTEGTVSCETAQGETREAGPGSMLLYRPREKQLYTYHAHSLAYWVHFTGTGAEELLGRAGLRERLGEYAGTPQECAALFGHILREYRCGNPAGEMLACARLAELIASAGRRGAALREKQGSGKFRRMEAVLARMQTGYAEEHAVAEYAAMCAVTVPHFISLFREYTGFSPHAYLVRIRMEHAAELLSDSDLGVGEVGRMVGYENALYFSRVFRAQTGRSPTEYRRFGAG